MNAGRMEQRKVDVALFGKGFPSSITNWAKEAVSPEQLQKDFDAVIIIAGGAEMR
ncbi:MAG: hypothetical protein Q7T25_03820 [Sideroxyarcus sp.]|nr:hypothetical protein [Sideroxyarcus sp.]